MSRNITQPPSTVSLFSPGNDDVKLHIYKYLSTPDLIKTMSVSSDNHNLAFYVLLMRRGKEACEYQQNLMSSWLSNDESLEFIKNRLSARDGGYQRIFKNMIKDIAGSLTHKLLCTLMINSLDNDKAELTNKLFEGLISLLKSPASATVSKACEILGLVSSKIPDDQLPAVMTILIGRLDDANSDARQAACKAVCLIASKISDVQLSTVVTTLIGRLGNASWYARLIGRLGNASWYAREAACEALGSIASKMSDDQLSRVATVLIERLDDADWHVRHAACKAVCSIASKMSDGQLPAVMTALTGRLGDAVCNVRQAACEAMRSIASKISADQLPTVTTALIRRLADDNVNVRQNALVALTFVRPSSDTLLEAAQSGVADDALELIAFQYIVECQHIAPTPHGNQASAEQASMLTLK